MKGSYTIHNLRTLHACFRHNEYTPLCQVNIKDTLLHINVQQLVIQKETNLWIEIDRPDISYKKGIRFPHKFSWPYLPNIGSEIKRDKNNTFDPDRSISIHLNPPSTERPPLVEIKQEGKNSIYTNDFYFTNKSPSNIVVPSPNQNNTTPTEDKAAAADPTVFDIDPLQPDKIHLHSWMLYTSQAPILDLTGNNIKSMKDIDHTFHALYLCPKENNKEIPNGREETRRTNKSLTDSDTSDDTEVDPRLRTSVEEREYNTIPGSVIATCTALSHSMAQANPMVEHGPLL